MSSSIHASILPTRAHLTRLMKLWRSAGWPSRDPIDLDLLAAGWVSLVGDHPAQECLKLTDAGLALLAQSRQAQRRAASTHDKLALRMADLLVETGRLVWHELSLRAQVEIEAPAEAPPLTTASSPGPQRAPFMASPSLWADEEANPDATPTPPKPAAQWRLARPDLFSVRRTSNPAYLQAMVHEIKVSRADLFSDLRNKAKRASYQWLCSECYYVFPAGMAEPKELPEDLGVWVLHSDTEGGRLEMLRPARHAPCTLPFEVWMALAQATPMQTEGVEVVQGELAEAAG
ncbi:hypothetical protein [Ideonella sp.]|uniref:hypothetical protein n=1 Tax=Ideonella sp. TaxID=1929293 RepID=UPI0037C13BEF